MNVEADQMNDLDDYDVFLETWEPGERLRHLTLPQNLRDPYMRQRLLDDSSGVAPVERVPFATGPKVMASDELIIRSHDFFKDSQKKWSAEFNDYVLGKGVAPAKLDTFLSGFTELWVDGLKRRQDSPEILAIKASIRDFDQFCYPSQAGRFVINAVDQSVVPLFTPAEMAAIFQANNGLIEAFLPDYLDHLGHEGPGSLDELYVRRGVYMPTQDAFRRELHYLSSYSLGLGPVEQFAQTWTPATRGSGIPSIFSAPLPAIQDRVVAFAPFIENMDLSQLEFVVAPPVEEMPLEDHGMFGNIREFSFR
ncbi:hypothetical protein HJC04_00110 [Rhizobium sp. NLR8a]|uniref:hypothetical protein n=1 Tax=Rhizobium sp. NLR8a TaxID=2731119 RepID=UPI001C82E25B|nr:hypothetical protein [Rhizobium sp. NLR8a]MBX5218770.1 hypothetical protein [Rhizobium sp. NLR8a]